MATVVRFGFGFAAAGVGLGFLPPSSASVPAAAVLRTLARAALARAAPFAVDAAIGPALAADAAARVSGFGAAGDV